MGGNSLLDLAEDWMRGGVKYRFSSTVIPSMLVGRAFLLLALLVLTLLLLLLLFDRISIQLRFDLLILMSTNDYYCFGNYMGTLYRIPIQDKILPEISTH